MSALPVEEDGDLRGALRDLEDAVDVLCGPQSHLLESKLIHVPSRYLQLMDAVTGEQANVGGGGGSKSRPPFWLDAFDMLQEIDTAAECWQPAFTGVPPTVGRLHWLLQRHWRPQDAKRVTLYAEAIKGWAGGIDELLNPKPKWTLPYPCPSCLTKTVYRRDSGGEMIRQPALQVSPETGVSCSKCRAHWPHGQLLFLGRLLQTLPDNVEA